MKKIILFLVLILTFQNMYSQDDNVEIITHRVALGETMLTIAKKYLVQPSEIYKLNKKANDGVSEGMLLYIPQPIKSQDIIAKRKEKREKEKIALIERKKEREERELAIAEEKAKEEVVVAVAEETETKTGRREEINKLNISTKKQFIDHEVASGETLSSLSRKYGVSIEEIQNENTKTLKNGLQIGQSLKMPVAQNLFISKDEPKPETSTVLVKEATNDKQSEITHKVVHGETLFAISKKYNVSVSEIQNENASLLKNGLQSGQLLKIKSKNGIATTNSDTIESTSISNNVSVESTTTDEFSIVKHKVEPKETLYSISKKYGVSVDEIKNLNETILTKGLQSGQEIDIKVKK